MLYEKIAFARPFRTRFLVATVFAGCPFFVCESQNNRAESKKDFI